MEIDSTACFRSTCSAETLTKYFFTRSANLKAPFSQGENNVHGSFQLRYRGDISI